MIAPTTIMKEITSIKNPLTIIAIFAGIAEISSTSVLPFISETNQSHFIWFVMGFPTLLVVMFFATLNLNHKVLYAPSDYRDDESFLQAMSHAQAAAKAAKYREEIQLVDTNIGVSESKAGASSPSEQTKNGIALQELLKRSARGSYFLAEELVLNKLSSELQGNFRREMMVGNEASAYMFDGVVTNGDYLTCLEVKYLRDSKFNKSIFEKTIDRLDKFYNSLSNTAKRGFTVILAVATDADLDQHDLIERELSMIIQTRKVPIELRIYDLKALEKDLELPNIL